MVHMIVLARHLSAVVLAALILLAITIALPLAPPPTSAPQGRELFLQHPEQPHPRATPAQTVRAQVARMAHPELFADEGWAAFDAFMRRDPRGAIVWREDRQLRPLVGHVEAQVHTRALAGQRAEVVARVIPRQGEPVLLTFHLSRDRADASSCAGCWRTDAITTR